MLGDCKHISSHPFFFFFLKYILLVLLLQLSHFFSPSSLLNVTLGCVKDARGVVG